MYWCVSALFLRKATAIVIDPCINIRKKTLIIYLCSKSHCTSLNFSSIYCQIYAERQKLKQWMRAMLGRWNGRKIPTQFAAYKCWKLPDSLVNTFVSLSCYEYCIHEIKFNLKYFSCLTKNSNLACRTLSRSTKFCEELHGFVMIGFLMTSWKWRYHNVVLAQFLTVIDHADFNNTILLWFI